MDYLPESAPGIRADGPNDIRAIRARIDTPVIGIRKVPFTGGPFIAPTCAEALEVFEAGALLVALEVTSRPRPGGETLEQVVGCIHSHGAAALADVATLDDGLVAVRARADLVGVGPAVLRVRPRRLNARDAMAELYERALSQAH